MVGAEEGGGREGGREGGGGGGGRKGEIPVARGHSPLDGVVEWGGGGLTSGGGRAGATGSIGWDN